MLPKEPKEIEYTPEERAQIVRLGVYVNMRWIAIVASVIIALVASQVFDIGFPTLPVYIICGFIALYNLVLFQQVRRLRKEQAGSVARKVQTYSNIHIFLDLVTLTTLLHFSGGLENPFIFLFSIHAIGAGILLPRRWAYAIGTLAILFPTLLVFLEYAEVVPHINLEGFVLPDRYKQLSRVAGTLVALTAMVYAATYLTTAVSGEMRKRHSQVVELRDRLLDKKTMELEQTSREVVKQEDERRQFVRFLSVVAHDLQAPLVATQSFISYILDGYTGEITEGQKDLLQRGSRRIDGLMTLIADLLDIPRIESGQIVREMQEISFNDVVKRAVDGLENIARQHGLSLKVELPQSQPRIYGAARRLQQVVTNLANNAINYTREGNVLVRVTDSDAEVRFEVLDSGIGILPEDLPRLFGDFFRGGNVEVRGTGLGLSISRRIVEAHRGKIWAESPCPETGKGSKFTFTLPKKPKQVGGTAGAGKPAQ